MKEEKTNLVEIYSTMNLAEISMIKGLLEAHDIPCFLENEHFSALYGDGFAGAFRARLMVPEDRVEECKRIIEEETTL